MKEVLEKLDGVEKRIAEDTQALVIKTAEGLKVDLVKSHEVLTEAVNAKVDEKLASFEAKFANQAVVTKPASLIQHCNSRVKKQVREWARGDGLANRPMDLKLFESEGEHAAYQAEKRTVLEASNLVNVGGSGKGGRVFYDPTFFIARKMNPLRGLAREVSTTGSDYTFVSKIGNAGVAYGYTPNVTTAGASNTLDTAIWNVTLASQNVQFATRTAILDDIPGLESSLIEDLMQEFSQVEGQTSIGNDPAAASTTPAFGGANAWRGLDFYAGQAATYAGGRNTLSAIVAGGNHQLGTYDQTTPNTTGGANNVSYKDLLNFIHNVIPVQYWSPNNTFMVSPVFLSGIRGLTDTQGAPIFYRANANVEGIVGQLFGFDVVVNPYVDSGIVTGAAGTNSQYPMYFGDFGGAYTYVDRLEMRMLRALETVPGSLTLWCERRTFGAIRNPAQIARYRSTAVST